MQIERKKPPYRGPRKRNQDLQEFCVRFYHAHKFDPVYAFTTKEQIALHLHDVELPKHFDPARLPTWTRIRCWLPREGTLKTSRALKSALDKDAQTPPPP